ncbi:MAG: hypothetical protein KJO36_01855, partial [Acidimicrobiia bacterium]|nr:hypothetical protein [Acidimicrobiia bacterium]
AWNNDESRILTTAGDDTTRMWDADSGEIIAVLDGHREAVLKGVWNQDESRILTASGDSTARQWYADIDDLVEAACDRAVRNMTFDEWQTFIGDRPYRPTCPDLPSGAN